MSYEEFIKENKGRLIGYYLLSVWFPERCRLETPSPVTELSEDELDQLKIRLNEFMPPESMIKDLWDWDLHFEDYLSDDWYFEAVFGGASSSRYCAEILAEFFLEKVDEFSMDYDQQAYTSYDDFKNMALEEALKFVNSWRQNIFDRCFQ